MTNRELANDILLALNLKGAALGTFSIGIIEGVLDANTEALRAQLTAANLQRDTLLLQVIRQESLLQRVSNAAIPCNDCDETGIEPNTEDACVVCGGYGFRKSIDHEIIIDIRAELEQVTK